MGRAERQLTLADNRRVVMLVDEADEVGLRAVVGDEHGGGQHAGALADKGVDYILRGRHLPVEPGDGSIGA